MTLSSVHEVGAYNHTALLECHGWTLLRVEGTHQIYGKTGSSVHLALPMRDNRPLKLGLLKYLLKTAGLPDQAIEALG